MTEVKSVSGCHLLVCSFNSPPFIVRPNQRCERQEVSRVDVIGVQTGTSDNSHVADSNPPVTRQHSSNKYIEQHRFSLIVCDFGRRGNGISCLTSSTSSHPTISQRHFGIIRLRTRTHDQSSFWASVLGEKVRQAVKKK